jgi:hypothetical protein
MISTYIYFVVCICGSLSLALLEACSLEACALANLVKKFLAAFNVAGRAAARGPVRTTL